MEHDSDPSAKRPRGRPKGVLAVKPYVKRVPKREGVPEPPLRQEEFLPIERGQVRQFLAQYEMSRTALYEEARRGNLHATTELFTRFHVTPVPIAVASCTPLTGVESVFRDTPTLTFEL